MKAMIIVDIPVDESFEIDGYSMAADMHIYPLTLTDRPELFFDLYDVPVRPMPLKRETQVAWQGIGGTRYRTHDVFDYDKGWNDCVEFLEGEEYD